MLWKFDLTTDNTVYFSFSGEAKTCVEVLDKLGYENATLEDCRVLQEICIAVSLRAARLAAAGLTCILRVSILYNC